MIKTKLANFLFELELLLWTENVKKFSVFSNSILSSIYLTVLIKSYLFKALINFYDNFGLFTYSNIN